MLMQHILHCVLRVAYLTCFLVSYTSKKLSVQLKNDDEIINDTPDDVKKRLATYWKPQGTTKLWLYLTHPTGKLLQNSSDLRLRFRSSDKIAREKKD
jgi:hypothetical protein